MASINPLKRHPVLFRSIWRRTHQQINPLLFQSIDVNEFPKSGGTWTCRMLSELLDWRFDDNTWPWFGNAIIKHHRLGLDRPRLITVIRDPRDVAVSYFHHTRQVFSGDGFNRFSVRMMHEQVFSGCKDEAEMLDAFVRRLVRDPITPGFTWGDFYRHPGRSGSVVLRYEDLRADTATALGVALDKLGIAVDMNRLRGVADRHDIEKIKAARKHIDGAFFIRKGEVGGWQNTLSAEAIALIEQDAGDLLDRYGYR